MTNTTRKSPTTLGAIFQLRSLKARVTIFTLAFFLLGILSLAFYASYSLYRDMQKALGEQQLSTVSIIAAEINTGINDRMRALENVAALITPAMLGNAASMQRFIEGRPILPMMFNGGFFVLLPDGNAIADYPLSTGRRGLNFMDRKYASGALKEGKTTIGNPVMGKALKSTLFSIATPIHNANGKVIGALAGTVDLAKPNFISRITDNTYGKTGGYLLVAPKVRTIVYATDKKRIMEVLPGPGINPLIDRAIKGWEGSGITIRPSNGVEILSSVKGIPVSGWYAAAIMPTAEAFAPIHAMMWRIILAAIFLTILLGSLTLWMLKRQLEPVFTTIKTLANLSDTDHSLQSLPISSQDEIGELIGGFNHLLSTLGKREEALKESDEKHKRMIANISDVIAIMDKDGTLKYKSPNIEKWFGWQPEDLTGIDGWETVHPDDLERIQKEFITLLDKDNSVATVEYRYKCKDGSYKLIALTAVNLTNDPIISGVLMNYRDITESKRIEEEKEKFEAQNRQLQKSESLARMAASIAHHFNNQLGVVIGNLEMAIDEQPKGVAPSNSLTSAMQAAWRSAEMSKLMLTYLGQSRDKIEPLDLAYSCRKILPILKAAIPANVILETDFSSPGSVINTSHDYMQQILTNLITNAWEAVGKNKGTISLSVKTVTPAEITKTHRHPIDWQQQDNAYACLEVSDTGCGIATKDIDQIFDPFFSTKLTGRGMGMAVVLGLIKSHKGVITVNSKPGSGSTFRVFFPLSEVALPQPQMAENDRDITISAPSPKKIEEGGKVLLVEDEVPLRKMVAIMLGRLGFTVLEAKDGIEALEVFGKHQSEIKFVLSDLTMPRMDGWETLTALRKLKPDITVILASGYDLAHVMAGVHPELPQVFLGKPYNLKALSDAIKQALERKKR